MKEGAVSMCWMWTMTKCFTTIHLRKCKMCSLSNPCSQAALERLANAHIDTVPPTHYSSCPETQPQCVVVWVKPINFGNHNQTFHTAAMFGYAPPRPFRSLSRHSFVFHNSHCAHGAWAQLICT